MDQKPEHGIPKNEDEKSMKKPQYERPKLIKLEEEMKWSKGGVCSGIV